MSPTSSSPDLLTALPATVPLIPLDLHGMDLTGSTPPGAFRVDGRFVSVRGDGGTGPTVLADGAPVVERVHVELGRAANLLHFPGLVRRELVGAGGIASETILAAPTLPFALLQWSGAAVPALRRIRIGLPASGEGAIVERSSAGVVLRSTEDTVTALALVSSGGVDVEVNGDVVFVLREGESHEAPTLVVAHGSRSAVRTALSAAAHAPTHALRAALGPGGEALRLRTGVAEIDEGAAWLTARLAGLVRNPTLPLLEGGGAGVPESIHLVLGLAALATGSRDIAATALGALPPDTAEGALLAARLASSLGDPGIASSAARALLSLDPDEAARSPDARLRAVGARALADGLRFAAPDSTIAELRRWADKCTAAGSLVLATETPSGGRRLPMAGASLPPVRDEPSWLAALLRGRPTTTPAPVSPARAMEARRATGGFLSNPDAAWTAWRDAVTRGLRAGPEGAGTWDGVVETPPPGTTAASATAELVLGLAHGLLGLDPDAPVGRLGLAPRLPSHLRAFRVDGIPLGDTRLALIYEREDGTHRFTLEPERASVPPLVVFEPLIPGPIRAVRVDGAPAELDLQPEAGRVRVPVQLPVDAPRIVEIDTDAGGWNP